MTESRRGLDRILQSRVIPARLFGGRVRTSTLALCILWLGLYTLHAYLNPEVESVEGPVLGPAVTTSEPARVPTYEPTTTETTQELPTTTVTVPEPTLEMPSITPSEQTPTTTSSSPLPFGIPPILPGPAGVETPTTTPASPPTTTQSGF